MSVTADNDMDAFNSFLLEQQAQGVVFATPEQSVQAYREYQKQLMEFQRLLEPALGQSARGETFEIDRDAFKADVLRHLAQKGIT